MESITMRIKSQCIDIIWFRVGVNIFRASTVSYLYHEKHLQVFTKVTIPIFKEEHNKRVLTHMQLRT